MKVLKKNQIAIYVIALMLVVAGYLSYTSTGDFNSAIKTSSSEEELVQMANIGDAQLVSSGVESDNNVLIENTNLTNNETIENSTTYTNSNVENNDKDYFETSRLERDTMYSQMIETYEKVLNSSNSLETQKQSASEEIVKINNIKNSIMISENLIKTKGVKDIVIFVNGESVSVIVEDEEVSPEEIAQIQNIISREMNVKVENIHISNK